MSESLTAKVRRTPIPVNRAAAAVLRGGIHYEENFVPRGEVLSEDPLPTRPYPRNSNPEDNLTGLKIGRFTVVGMASDNASWVVRCACGRYCYRKAKVLKSRSPEGKMSVMCPRCAGSNLRGQRKDAAKESLHKAALQLFLSLQECLGDINAPGVRARARKALGRAYGNHDPEDNWDGYGRIMEILRERK